MKKKVSESASEFRIEFIDKVTTLLISAFGLIAALAWNSAIQNWFKEQEALNSMGPWAYALFVTFLAVLVTLYLSKLSKKYKKNK